MNLPQNIQKSDGAIARSFSQELGLNLDFKTGRETLWQGGEYAGSNGIAITSAKKKMATFDNNIIAIWDLTNKRVIKRINKFPDSFFSTNSYDYYLFEFLSEDLLLFCQYQSLYYLNIETGSFEFFTESLSGYSYSKEFGLLVITDKKTGEVKLYNKKDVETSIFKVLREDAKKIKQIKFSGDNKYLFLFFSINSQSLNVEVYETSNFSKIDSYTIFSGNKDSTNYWMKILFCKNKHLIVYEHNNEIFEYSSLTNKNKILIDRIEWPLLLKANNKCILEHKKDNIDNLKYISTLNCYSTENGQLLNSIKFNDYEVSRIDLLDSSITISAKSKKDEKHIFMYSHQLQLIDEISTSTVYEKVTQFNNCSFTLTGGSTILDLQDFKVYNVQVKHNNGSLNISNPNYALSVNKETNEIAFLNLENKQIQKLTLPASFKNNVSYINISNQKDKWLLYHKINFLLYDTSVNKIIKQFKLPTSTDYISKLVSVDLKQIYYLKDNQIKKFNIEKGEIVRSSILTTKPHSIGQLFFSSDNNSIYFVRLAKLDNESEFQYFIFSEFDTELKMVRQEKLNISPLSQTPTFIVIDFYKNSNKLLLGALNTTASIVDIFDLSVTMIAECNNAAWNKPILSKDAKFLIYRETGNKLLRYNLLTEEAKEILQTSNNISFLNFFIDEVNNHLIVPMEHHTEIYNIDNCKLKAKLFFESEGSCFIHTVPDTTSPNGWFYTNVPDKINVVKTKADGSEPELLPIDDEERLAFIKHHNRKDIVMNKLFEPEKYEKFIKLNANAEDMAKQEMAIELSKVEQKKLET